MSPRKESAVRAILVGLAITLGAAIVSAAFNSKESVADHALDQGKTDANMQRVLDLLCEGQPTKRACK